MVMVEAMACGTPVVATRRGSVPEVVVDGECGIIVDRPDELPAAIERAGALDRAACRRRARTAFDLPVMARGYVEIYRAALAARRGAPGAPAAEALAGSSARRRFE